MPEPVRFTRIAEAYSNGANAYFTQRNWPNNPVKDTVEISNEAKKRFEEFLSSVNKQSYSENPASRGQPEEGIAILKLPATATKDQIRKAYRTAMKQYHPDNFAGLSPEFRELAEEKSKQINRAYQKLTGM